MSYKKTEMLYDDGIYYNWKAIKQQYDPPAKGEIDQLKLNRTEGYEVLYFINCFGQKHFTSSNPPDLSSYQKIEKMIRYVVPSKIQFHDKITDWIAENWERGNFI